MRKEKEYLLDDIKERIDRAKSFIIAKYTKVTANSMSEFRNLMSNSGNDFEIVAKRLFMKAAESHGLELKKQNLQGHIGIVFPTEDFLSAAKSVHKYGDDNPESIEILGGFYEGKIYDKESVIRLSQLPSKEEMRAQLLATLEAPMVQTLGTFEALLTSIIHCLDNKSKQEAN